MSSLADSNKSMNNFNLIRLLAATQVLVVHSCNHFGVDGFVIKFLKIFPGVPIFFFISGYLIGGTYIKNYHKGLFVFFRNRILRLFPGLIFCVIISFAAVFFTGYFSTKEISVTHFVAWFFGQITFLQFYNPEFMRDYGVGVLNGSLWTITVEIQFYLLTPLILLLLKLKRNMGLIVLVLFFSIIINLYLRLYSDWSKFYIKILTVTFLPWVFIFIIGFLFKFYEKHIFFLKKLNLFFVFLIFAFSMVTIGDYKSNAMNSINPISIIILSVFIYIFSGRKLKLPFWVENFVQHNDLSYGLYIYHMPIINTILYLQFANLYLNILITITLTMLFSYLSWKFIEKPFLQKKS